MLTAVHVLMYKLSFEIGNDLSLKADYVLLNLNDGGHIDVGFLENGLETFNLTFKLLHLKTNTGSIRHHLNVW